MGRLHIVTITAAVNPMRKRCSFATMLSAVRAMLPMSIN